MLIKKADGQDEELAELEKRANSSGQQAQWARVELRNRKAGIKGEQEAAYLIDFSYANSDNWCVIHDLRLEARGRVAQIDHLLVNRFLDVYVLETKHFHAGVKITEEGEFLRWNNFKKRYEGMPSPIEQNLRHVEVLRDVLGEMELPRRMGVRIMPTIETYVLVSENANIIRPKRFDTSRVVKPGQLKSKIFNKITSMNILVGGAKLIGKTVSRRSMELFARDLARQHKPLRKEEVEAVGEQPSPWRRIVERFRGSAGQMRQEQGQEAAPECRKCSSGRGSIQYGRYGYYFRCKECSENTAVRFSCQKGHNPRLRKRGYRFYRDCPQCGSSSLYFQNR